MRAQLDVIIGAEGLTTLQYTALSVLALHPGMPSAKLARHSFVTPQAANEMTMALERKGLLQRRDDPVNRRIVALHLTAAGRALLSRCDAHVDALEARMLGVLPRGDRRRFVEMMRACLGALREE